MIRRCMLSLAVLVLASVARPSAAQLNWDGQGGAFLNALAFPTAAGSIQAAFHFIDLESLGTIKTYSVNGGLRGGIEVGFNRVNTNVTGVADQNLLHAKWQFLAAEGNRPALAAWLVYRDLLGGADATDYGLTATTVLKPGGTPVVVSGGLRSTKSRGMALFGVGDRRRLKWEGSVAVFANPRLLFATEFKEQIGGRTWTDLAVRYLAGKGVNVDVGVANFGPGINNQFALGITYSR